MKHFPIAIAVAFCGAATLSACEQTPAEKLAVLHSEQQSRINSENYERSAQLREIQEEKQEEKADKEDGDDDADE